MKNRRTLLIFGGVFAVLLIVVVLQGTSFDPLAQPAPDDEIDEQLLNLPRVLTDFRVLDIQAIRISSPYTEQEFVMTRTQEGQWIAPDLEGNLDSEQATLIARTTVLLPYSSTIPIENETELAQFGFVSQNPGALTMEILLVDGTSHALFFGGLTPLQDAIYTVADDRNDIYLVEPRAVEFLRTQMRNPPVNLTTE